MEGHDPNGKGHFVARQRPTASNVVPPMDTYERDALRPAAALTRAEAHALRRSAPLTASEFESLRRLAEHGINPLRRL